MSHNVKTTKCHIYGGPDDGAVIDKLLTSDNQSPAAFTHRKSTYFLTGWTRSGEPKYSTSCHQTKPPHQQNKSHE